MLQSALALFILSLALIAATIYWAFANHRRYKLNLLLTDELTRLIENTTSTLQKTKKSSGLRPGMHPAPRSLTFLTNRN
jgi:maltodextrin utilization protein YvdJ